MENNLIVQMIPSTFMIISPILIAAVGGMICERSGIVNIALEGLMVIGAMTAATTHVLLESGFAFSIPLALLLSALAGGLFALVHAFTSITLKADQVISGMGINLLSAGITLFVCQIVFRMDRTPYFQTGMKTGLFGIYPVIIIAVVIFLIAWFVMCRHSWGLRLRAAGENPRALVCSGVSVVRIQYVAVLISGLLAGLAGGCIVLTLEIQFTAGAIGGKGFIALAAVYLGRHLPLGILASSFLFGFVSSVAVNAINLKGLQFLPPEVFYILPFLITLLALVIFGRKKTQY
jgi:simple sugar transport system permease protein